MNLERRFAGQALAEASSYQVFVEDLEVMCRIGVHRHERAAAQRILVSVALEIDEGALPGDDEIESALSYDDIVAHVRRLASGAHVNLVETLAERIAAACLDDPRVFEARVRIAKPDVLAEARAVGVEIARRRPRG